MKSENVGVITELIDKNNGIIMDSKGEEYLICRSDLISDFELKVGLKVIFKSYISFINNIEIRQAVLVELFH